MCHVAGEAGLIRKIQISLTIYQIKETLWFKLIIFTFEKKNKIMLLEIIKYLSTN